MPTTSSPFHSPRQTTPVSVIAAASDPACSLVSAKAGISLPSARRGSQRSRCASVPNCNSSSPGPSEFGTITVTAAASDFVVMRRMISECAKAENPSPP